MKLRRIAPGASGWAAIAVVVVVAEYKDSRTMSDFFYDVSRHKGTGLALGIFYLTLGAHLFGIIPRKYDPYHVLAGATFAKGREGYGWHS